MTGTYVLVTKTYRGDISLFRELCDSIDRHMPHVEHHVLIDQSDLELFKQFESENRRLVSCSELLPSYREFHWGQKRLWWRWPMTIVRGWIYQQLAKVEYVRTLDADAAVLVDSDAIFIREIQPDDLFAEGSLKLYRCPGKSSGPADQSPKWHNAAARSFGLEERGYTGADYISNAVIWSPSIVRRMVETIEAKFGLPWDRVLTRNFRFSEYVLYGVFCDHVAGPHQNIVKGTIEELCHCSWDYNIDTQEGTKRFHDSLKPHHCAILIQSNLGMSDSQRSDVIREFMPITSVK